MQAIWIELPALDLHRSKAFYEAVFAHPATEAVDNGTRTITVIPGNPTVSLNQTPGFRPHADGTLPYFQVPELDTAVAAALSNGGRVVEPRHERPGFGWFALILDSEGNPLYLHADH